MTDVITVRITKALRERIETRAKELGPRPANVVRSTLARELEREETVGSDDVARAVRAIADYVCGGGDDEAVARACKQLEGR